jgi:hypothetical protein
MTVNTALGPALARRSHGVSVPGAPMRATFSMRALPPAVARSGQHVSHSPGSVLAGRPPIRDGRFPVGLPTGRSSSRGSLRNSTPAHNRFCLKASGSDGVGGFF